jgi:hypothetical protein
MPFGLQRKKQKVVDVHIRLALDEAELIEQVARKHNLSFAAETRFLIRQVLKTLSTPA